MARIDDIIAYKAARYKKRIASRFVLVEGDRIADKVYGSDFIVTRKLDGMMQLVFIEGNEVKSVSRNGKILDGTVPVVEEFRRLVTAAGIDAGVFGAEMYVRYADGRRERVRDVSTALSEIRNGIEATNRTLCMAPFDILSINGDEYESPHYREKHKELQRIFGDSDCCRPVEAFEASSKNEIKDIYRQLVTEGGAEGLVVHSESTSVYKVKKRHTFDGAVIGYVTADIDDCSIRSMLIGMKRTDGLWQVVGTVGTGISDEQRKEFYELLAPDGVESEYIETDSRGVAYRMVVPRLVFELSALDLVTENSLGEAKLNPLLAFDPDEGFIVKGEVAGVSILSFIIKEMRSDKQADETDVRISQLTDIVEFGTATNLSVDALPKSEILARHVYRKGEGPKMMVHKFIVIKTNKEQSGVFPAYVLHHTDYSCSRKELLKRDLRISSSRDQIFALLDAFIAENIKKGWEEVISN